jgi:hypothetical protein
MTLNSPFKVFKLILGLKDSLWGRLDLRGRGASYLLGRR